MRYNAIRGHGRLFALWFLGVLGLWAQSDTARLTGLVTDQSGAIIPGSEIVVANEATGLSRTASTNESGRYNVPNLPPGIYTVGVEAPGFKRFVTTGAKLDANLAATVNVQLELGEVTETIEVAATTGAIQSETATLGKTIEQRQIDTAVLNGRNPLLLALLKAGVRRNTSLADFTFGLTSGGYSINGSRTQDNMITFDGAPGIRTRASGTAIGVPDADAVQEIQVLTSAYAAEYGNTNGGQIRVVTKSGTKDFHANFYEFFRNDKLDANSFNRNAGGLDRQPVRFNQFGYNVSGPVYIPGKLNPNKNRLFFLWGQEWVRFRDSATSTITTPSLAMRQGDFSELLDPGNTFFNGARVITDPTTGQAFANNAIPASRQSRNGMAFLNTFPNPTPGFQQGSNNTILTGGQPTNQRKDTLSIDAVPRENHNLRLRFQNYNFVNTNAFGGGTDRAPRIIDRPNRTASLNHIWTASPTVVNELLVTASVDEVDFTVAPGSPYQGSLFGIDFETIFPRERKELPDKIPTINIQNFQEIDGGALPGASSGPIYTIGNSTSLIRGNHTVKFGGQYIRRGQNDFDQINVQGVPGGTNNQNGRFVFTDARTGGSGLAIGNAALGLFDTFAEIGDRAFTPYRGNSGSLFVQDSWNATSKLKIEAGVRWELIQPYFFSNYRNMSVFYPELFDPAQAVSIDPSSGNIIPGSGDTLNGVRIPGTGFTEGAIGRIAGAGTPELDRLFDGGSKTPADFHWDNIAPRFGLAYRLSDKSVIRAGGGRFFNLPGVSDNIFLGGNAPFQPQVSISNGLADRPGGGTSNDFPLFFMTIDPRFKIPSSWNWNVSYQQALGFSTTLELSYVGATGSHLERVRELNALQPGTLTDPANAGINANALRPFPGFSFINLGENAARSEYQGFQLNLNRRFAKGLGIDFAYTLSESKDNASGRRDQIWNPFDDSSFWGNSAFDSRHVAVINAIWEVPFMREQRGALGKALGGWQLSSVIQFQTGTPFTVGRNQDLAGIGVGNQFQPFEMLSGRGIEVKPEDRGFSSGPNDPTRFLNSTAPDGRSIFFRPEPGTFATTQARNEFHNPGFNNWNLGIFKTFEVTTVKDIPQKVDFRAELMNAVNHPNLSGVNTDPQAAAFGRITSKNSQRQIQLSLRYSF